MNNTENSAARACAAEQGRRWHQRVLWLIGLLLLVRLVYLLVVPLDLIHDEAYYWDWSRRLDWGYYSKPPLIAWLIALVTQVGGSTTVVVRLPAVFLGTCGLYTLYLLATRLYDPKVGFFSVLICAATPGNAALSLLMTIDAPFLFFWGCSLYALWRLLERDGTSPIWLVTMVVTTGLGLLAKQTMIAILLCFTAFVVLSPADRRRLLRPGYLAIVAGSLAFLIPVMAWNARHDWVTFHHTGNHFAPTNTELHRRLIRGGEFLLGQLGVVSPLTMAMVLSALAMGGWAFFQLERRERFLICFSGLPLAAVIGLSFIIRVQPNWPAAFHPAAMILMVAWVLGRIEGLAAFFPPRALSWAIACGTVCATLTYAVPFATRPLGLDQRGLDPTVRMRGWTQLAVEVDRVLRGLPHPEQTLVVVTTDRAAASELAFYLREQPEVFVWTGSPLVTSQYDLWDGPQDRCGWDAAIVTRASGSVPTELAAAFATVSLAAEVEVPLSSTRSHHYQLWLGTRLRQWPVRPFHGRRRGFHSPRLAAALTARP